MSSVVTAVPSGPVPDWCIMTPWFGSDRQGCANSTRGTTEFDFETICCDGSIVNTKFDIFRSHGQQIDLADLACCRVQGPQQGGLLPLPTNAATECTSGTPVPLVSLAATNTQNAQGYLVTYTSASFGTDGTGDFIPTKTPYCLWAYTKGVALTSVTVPAAQITSLSSSSSFQNGPVSTVSGGQLSTQDANTMRTTSMTRSGSSTSGESRSTSTSSSSESSIALKDVWLLAVICFAVTALPSFV